MGRFVRDAVIAGLGLSTVIIALAVSDTLDSSASQVTEDSTSDQADSELSLPAADDPSPLPSMIDATLGGYGDPSLSPVDVSEATELRLGFYSDMGYIDQEGSYYVDVLEQDFAYLTLIITDGEGRPVSGATPTFASAGDDLVIFPQDDPVRSKTRDDGTVDFGVIGGTMGLNPLEVTVDGYKQTLLVNTISLQVAGFAPLPVIEGALNWQQLMSARVRWDNNERTVAFPDDVQAESGQKIKLSGFMMPLDPGLSQKRFLLTSNPPSCFFHIPGGPAGAVEVFAPDGVDATWDPIVLEGRFETLTTDEYGVIYRLHEAEFVPYKG